MKSRPASDKVTRKPTHKQTPTAQRPAKTFEKEAPALGEEQAP